MTNEDIKTSKKFMCAGELARVFKSMICLFLTSSYILLRFKIVTEQELKSGDDLNIDGLVELSSQLIDNDKSCNAANDDFDSTGNNDNAFDQNEFDQSQGGQNFILDVLTIFSIGLTFIQVIIELQQVINMCLDLTDDDDDIIPGRPSMTQDAGGKLIKDGKD